MDPLQEAMEFWTALGAVSAFLTFLVVAGSLLAMLFQLVAMKRSAYFEAYCTVRDILQEEEVREARRFVFDLAKKRGEDWTEDKTAREQAEIVCHTYDAVGQIVRNKLLPKGYIKSWAVSIRPLWKILSPLVTKYRDERGEVDTWDDFEWLAQQFFRCVWCRKNVRSGDYLKTPEDWEPKSMQAGILGGTTAGPGLESSQPASVRPARGRRHLDEVCRNCGFDYLRGDEDGLEGAVAAGKSSSDAYRMGYGDGEADRSQR